MKKTILIGFLTLAVLMSVWSGGQGGEAQSDQKVTVKVMWNAATVSVYDPFFEEYNQKNPNAKVVVDAVPYSDLETKLMLALVDPKGEYDFLLSGGQSIPKYAGEDLIVEVGSLGPYDWDDWYEGALGEAMYEGKIYSIPIRINTLGLIYNKKLFKEAGVALPTEEFSWADFENAAGKIKKGDTYGFVTFYARGTLSPSTWYAIVFSHGGKLLAPDKRPSFNDAIGVKSLQQFTDYQKYGPVGMANWDINEAHEAFRQGKAGMIFTWSGSFWNVAADPEKSIPGETKDGVFRPLPKGDKFMGTLAGNYCPTIPKVSKHIEEAWDFLKWLGSKETQRKLAAAGTQSARISVLHDPVLLSENRGFEGLARTWEMAGEGGMYLPRIADIEGVRVIWGKYINMAVVGEMTAQEALDEAANEVEAMLEELGYYK